METGLRLLDGTLAPVRLAAVLERFHGFWAAVEPAVDAWADVHPEAAAELDWPRRRRVPVLEADLRALGHAPALAHMVPTVAAPVFGPGAVDTAQVLGWLYVAEGSTLGGAVIERRLAADPTVDVAPLRFFVPYPEGPGPMWQIYLDALDTWAGADETRARRVEDAAACVFDALAAWLAPVLLQDAA